VRGDTLARFYRELGENLTRNGEGVPIRLALGKAGSSIKAMAESIGRLISLIFRLESIPPYERAVAIVEQLSGIGGARSVGTGSDKILSLPDAISKAMAEHYKLNDVRANNMSVPADAAHADKSQPRPISNADICPSCGQSSYIRQEGCTLCLSCGHSEC